MSESREEMLKKLRVKLNERARTRRDPDQFIPPKAKDGETLEYYFRILPPLEAGETSRTGAVETSMDFFFYENGSHYINNERYECPRLHDKEDCPICKMGFDLMEGNDDKGYRSSIAKKYLPRSYYAINVYFPNIDRNPESFRGKVMWFNMPKTVYDVMEDCLQNDDPGDKEDPRPTGLFYHPTEGYTFKLIIEKQGEYNSYEKSKFLVKLGAIINNKDGSPNESAIQKILDQRFYIPGKFKGRDFNKLQEIVNKLLEKDSGDDTQEIGGATASQTRNVKPALKAAPKAEESVQEVSEDPPEVAAPVKSVIKPKPVLVKPPSKPKIQQPSVPLGESVEKEEEDPDMEKLVQEISNSQ